MKSPQEIERLIRAKEAQFKEAISNAIEADKPSDKKYWRDVAQSDLAMKLAYEIVLNGEGSPEILEMFGG